MTVIVKIQGTENEEKFYQYTNVKNVLPNKSNSKSKNFEL